MDIREYFQKNQKELYKIITKNLTIEIRKQFYGAINDWHEKELSQYNDFVNMQYHGVSLDGSDIDDFNS
jgi:hypothetical protein